MGGSELSEKSIANPSNVQIRDYSFKLGRQLDCVEDESLIKNIEEKWIKDAQLISHVKRNDSFLDSYQPVPNLEIPPQFQYQTSQNIHCLRYQKETDQIIEQAK